MRITAVNPSSGFREGEMGTERGKIEYIETIFIELNIHTNKRYRGEKQRKIPNSGFRKEDMEDLYSKL